MLLLRTRLPDHLSSYPLSNKIDMQKTEFADKFNHDGWETIYDHNVTDESNPIRAGYDACLSWVAEKAAVDGLAVVADLGIGTGNLSQRLPGCKHLIGVDMSTKMMEVGREKLAHHAQVTFVEGDLLAYFADAPALDAVVSTYAVHHLTEPEKAELFQAIDRVLNPGGRAVFGDLMLESVAAREAAVARYEAEGRLNVAFDIQDEFFWLIDGCAAAMRALGWQLETVRFSDLSWGIAATKREG